MDPLSLSLLIGAGTSLLGGAIGAFSSGQAADTQADASKAAIKAQQKAIAQARKDSLPWMTAGKNALAQLQGELGLSTKGANGKPFVSQFKTTPGYDFATSEGEKGVVNNMRALGLGGSGAALKALTRFRTGLADQTYNQYLDRLSGVSVGGQTTSANSGNQAISSAAGVANGIENAGAATASGYAGVGNSLNGALGNFANNAGSALGNYNNDWSRV